MRGLLVARWLGNLLMAQLSKRDLEPAVRAFLVGVLSDSPAKSA
jgi:hypothetical protein